MKVFISQAMRGLTDEEILKTREEAIKFAKSCLHAALKDTEEIVDNNQKDIILICQMIKDNLSLWKNEMPEELNMLWSNR